MTGTVPDPSSPGTQQIASDSIDERFDERLLPIGRSDAERVSSLAETPAEAAGMMQTAVRVLHVFTPAAFERTSERLGDGTADRPDPDALARRVAPSSR